MIAFIFLFLILIKYSAAECPSNTTEWQSSCFSFFNISTGFADAELRCKKVGGHLAAIHDGFTNALLAQEALNNFHESTQVDFWIGATNLIKPPMWNWTDGSPFDFTDWNKGEPQNTSGANCAAISTVDGYWTAQDCFKPKPFACQVPSSVYYIPTTPSYPANANCSMGWFYFPPTHSCYGANAGGFVGNWNAAETYCEDSKAQLPSIHSVAEFEYLTSLLYIDWANVWTGIFSIDNGRSWKASDNTSADFEKFGPWCPGRPLTNITGERCVAVGSIAGIGCYYDYNSTDRSFHTVCKKPL
uniref:C-type lectin domain-containing protein n=1 Tax=Panagrolaimus superbus TaxID=310955 RepID=A0A914ZBD7_9BILA